MLIKIAKVFGVSTDYLLLEEPTTVQGTKIKDKDLLKSFEKADQMGDNDKELIKIFIDAFIKKRQVEKVMQDWFYLQEKKQQPGTGLSLRSGLVLVWEELGQP